MKGCRASLGGHLQKSYSTCSKALEENFHLGKLSLIKYLDCFVHSCIPRAYNSAWCITRSIDICRRTNRRRWGRGESRGRAARAFPSGLAGAASVQTSSQYTAVPREASPSGRLYQVKSQAQLNATVA